MADMGERRWEQRASRNRKCKHFDEEGDGSGDSCELSEGKFQNEEIREPRATRGQWQKVKGKGPVTRDSAENWILH